ncbi:MAG: transcriptional regulator, partial [Glaciihabitans sp.]|nr:transcriptional regulator [Glaciihabitans sp.]
IGFDGIDATLDYDLTTLVQPAVAKGRAAGRAVLQLLDGSDPEGVDFSATFHKGNTTAVAAP